MASRVVLAAALAFFLVEVRAEPLLESAGSSPSLIIYPARGPANSCGPGCNRWIAIEGIVDRAAASRINRFLHETKDTDRPIYFNSPGGSMGQALTIGRLLRVRGGVVARVGRTIATACAAGTQVDDACLKVKTAGIEVEAEISTNRATCNSACSDMFFGATTRELAPDAVMAVHNPRLVPIGKASPEVIASLRDRSMVQVDLEQTAFITAMGISRELGDLIETVKFENPHVLTRPELYRFGIDTRTMAETAWTLERTVHPFVRKVVQAKIGDGSAFRTLHWQLFCENKERARLVFAREFNTGEAGTVSVTLTAGSEKSLAFGKFPVLAGKYEVWNDTLAPDRVKALLEAPRLQMREVFSAPDGKTNVSFIDIDSNGLEQGWAQLLTTCPAAPVQSIIASPAAGSSLAH